MKQSLILVTSTSPLESLNSTISAAQGAATWAGSATLAFMGCLMLAAIAAYVVHHR